MGFESCHPAVNFLFFAAVIGGTLVFRHPVYLAVSLGCAAAYSIRRNGKRAIVFDLAALAAAVGFALYYASYHHFGMTVLRRNFVDNNMTLESFVYGLVLGLSYAGAAMWFSCVHSVVTADKVVYLFGRISPRLSLFLAILLRMVPRIKREARRIHTAQQGLGKGIGQGNLLQRSWHALRIASMLITWAIEALMTSSESMQSRGSTLRGRTAFSVYRFDNRDRAYVIALFLFLTLTGMAILLGQTESIYDPRILITPMTPMFWLFSTGYCALCLMPMALELWNEFRFRQARKNVE